MSESVKVSVLNAIAIGRSVTPLGHAKYRIAGWTVHVRFCSVNTKASAKFKFNLNPNTLSADYELWICGSPTRFYLMPRSTVLMMYEHPAAYIDRRHPEIRVVSLDVTDNAATFAAGGEKLDLRRFLNRTLDAAAA